MNVHEEKNVARSLRVPAAVKAVLDTGVLRSAVWGGRASTQIVDAWLDGRVLFCVTESIMTDYFSSLRRLPPTPLISLVLDHLRSGEAVRAFLVQGIATGAPPEDTLVMCARQAGAAAVVTHDRVLLDLGQMGSIAMVTPGAFVSRFLSLASSE